MTPKTRRKTIQALTPWLTMLVFLLVWQLGSSLFKSSNLTLPAPTIIGNSIVLHRDAILFNALQTLIEALLGFGAALIVGVACGLAIGAWAVVYRGVYPLLIAFNAIPKVALVPILVLWFGIGSIPATILAFSLAVFPIIVNVATGLATIDPEMEDVMRSLGASRFEVLTKIGIPGMMPYLFASLKIAITLAFVGAVLSETVAANNGIGFLMSTASSRFDVPLAFAGLVVVAVMAIVSYAVCALIEQRVTGWSMRGARR